jgi:hypothetical protein
MLDCWHERFDIRAYARQHLTPEQLEKILAPPKPRMTSLIELIQQAKESASQPDT